MPWLYVDRETAKKIEDICDQYGYTMCESCPLYDSCMVNRDEGESETAFTKRWELGMADAIHFTPSEEKTQ